MPIATSPVPSEAASSQLSLERPHNIGIKAIELYFPNTCVDQAELEKADGVSSGKYTAGLGQTRMSFCNDREDVYSICLTVLSSLLRKYAIDPKSIGRLEVGTETLLDKSKSVKSVLMQLFAEENTDIEGVDNINACYGGTNALFNAVNWVGSPSWDGRDAIVVAGDIAIYGSGPARPTGGAGAVAMLIGPNAPVAVLPVRGSYMQHCYDFYKPDFSSEYPIVHGHYSLECYTRALDKCYEAYKRREERFVYSGLPAIPKLISDRFDFMCFHSPNTKLVSKAFARLSYNDFKEQPDHPSFSTIDTTFRSVNYEESLKDRKLEAAFKTQSAEPFAQRVSPSITAPTMCGNMYTASLYSSLASLLSNVEPEKLLGKTVGMFSYGSGLASTLFCLEVVGDTSNLRKALDLTKRLEAREVVDPVGYSKAIWLREKAHLQKGFVPHGEISSLVPGTYYLAKVDDQYRRTYAIAGSPRAIGILAVAKASGLQLEEVEIQPANGVPEEYRKLNKLGKTPTFVGADGLVLTECIAIALYITSQDPTSTLLGASELDFILVLRWLSLTNTDVVNRMADWIRPLIGYTPYSKEAVEKAQRETDQAIQIFEDHLQDRKYLVADRLTLADIFCAGLLTFGFAKVFDEKWRKRFPYFTGWFVCITNLPMFRAVAPVVNMVSEGLPNQPPTEPFKAP
ncbi:3-hydroxy-3-methylglutaryl coenzyme A synthase [Microsporum audouinii]